MGLSDFDGTIARFDYWLRLNGAPPEDALRGAASYRRHVPPRYTIQAPGRATRGRPAHHIARASTSFQVRLDRPGHTSGHICLWDEQRKTILTGDHVLDPDLPERQLEPTCEGQGNPLGEYLQSLRKVAELDADLVLPAHGDRSAAPPAACEPSCWPTTTSAKPRFWRRGEPRRADWPTRFRRPLPWTRRKRTLADLLDGPAADGADRDDRSP